MQLEHLAEADGPVEGTGDEVSDTGVSLCFISISMLELEFTEKGHQVVYSQVNIHEIGPTVFQKESEVE